MARPTKRRLREAIEESGGIIAAVARMFGVSRQTVYNWLDRYPELTLDLEHAREDIIDVAEANIFREVRKGNIDLSKFVLTRLGKNRGWSSRTEMTGADGEALQLSPDTLQLLAAAGIQVEDVAAEFERMVREHAMQSQGRD